MKGVMDSAKVEKDERHINERTFNAHVDYRL